MRRILIVNADDCNLTGGVTRAIVACHERGIVTSTTLLVNLPAAEEAAQLLKRQKHLGVGLHLNITLGRPVSTPREARSLIDRSGIFRKIQIIGARRTAPFHKPHEIEFEYQNQILLFQKIFGRGPTHLDTHHQLHDHPFYFRVLVDVARKNHLPIRRSRLTRYDTQTTDYLFGNLSPAGYWRREALEMLLRNLPEGVSEIMCHPGKNDRDLAKISSFTRGREAEKKIFGVLSLRRLVQKLGITLSHYGLCYT